MLKFDIINEIVKYIESKYKNKFNITYAMNTNLTYINNDIIRFFKDYNFTIAISLDGNKQEHDKIRIFKNGTPSFNKIIKNIKKLNNEKIKLDVISLTLTKENLDLNIDEFIKLLKILNVKKLRVDPDMLELIDPDLDKLTNILLEFEKKANAHHIEIIGYWKKPYYNLFKSRNELGMAFCSPYNGEIVSIQNDGNISLCIYEDIYLDNINNLFNNKHWNWENYIDKLNKFWIENLKQCDGCELEGLCLGGCHLSQNNLSPKNREKICDFYKLITKKLIFYHSEAFIL